MARSHRRTACGVADTVRPASQCWEAWVSLGDKDSLILPRVRAKRRQVPVDETEQSMGDLGCQRKELGLYSVASQKRLMESE